MPGLGRLCKPITGGGGGGGGGDPDPLTNRSHPPPLDWRWPLSKVVSNIWRKFVKDTFGFNRLGLEL